MKGFQVSILCLIFVLTNMRYPKFQLCCLISILKMYYLSFCFVQYYLYKLFKVRIGNSTPTFFKRVAPKEWLSSIIIVKVVGNEGLNVSNVVDKEETGGGGIMRLPYMELDKSRVQAVSDLLVSFLTRLFPSTFCPLQPISTWWPEWSFHIHKSDHRNPQLQILLWLFIPFRVKPMSLLCVRSSNFSWPVVFLWPSFFSPFLCFSQPSFPAISQTSFHQFWSHIFIIIFISL